MDEKQIIAMLDAHIKKFDELSKTVVRSSVPEYNQKVYAELLKQEGRIITTLIDKL